jgi:hypothetical protein
LLDDLAWCFMHEGWNIKSFMRMLVTSATYRQSCIVTPAARQIDPLNRLLSRGPRFRLDGEVIRDSVLAASGLVSTQMAGPPVKPYQPDGIWEAVAHHASKTAKYQRDSGDNLYRRSIYTLWKRGAPPPSMQVFDAPNRDLCVVRRDRTNTPLQALLTMNDVQFIEAARVMAAQALQQDISDRERMARLFRRAVARRPTERELAILDGSLERLRGLYDGQPALGAELLQVGDASAPSSAHPAEHATWTILCNQLLNLDEFVMKE